MQLELFPLDPTQDELHAAATEAPAVRGYATCAKCGGFGFVLLPAGVPGYEQAWEDIDHVAHTLDGLHYLSCRTCRPTTL
jgi:hypothetical protein